MNIEVGDIIHYKYKISQINRIYTVIHISASTISDYILYTLDDGKKISKHSLMYNDIMKNYQKYVNIIANENIIRKLKIKEIL